MTYARPKLRFSKLFLIKSIVIEIHVICGIIIIIYTDMVIVWKYYNVYDIVIIPSVPKKISDK